MKKIALRIIALTLAIVLGMSLAGCSLNLNDMIIVKRAYKNVSEMDSLSFTGNAELNAVAGSLPITLKLKADCHCIIDPVTLQIQANFDLGKLGKIDLPLYIFVQDNALQVLAGLGRSSGTTWVNNSFPLAEKNGKKGNGLSVESVLNMLQNDPEALVVGESETVNDVVARPFILKVPGDILMAAIDLTPPEDSSAAIEDTLLTIWIAESDGMPVRLSADLASLFQYIVDVTNPDYLPKLKISSMPTMIDLTGYNDVESISLPSMPAA